MRKALFWVSEGGHSRAEELKEEATLNVGLHPIGWVTEQKREQSVYIVTPSFYQFVCLSFPSVKLL